MNRYHIEELIEEKCGEKKCVTEIFHMLKEKKWHVQLTNKKHVNILVNEGIEYTFGGEVHVAKATDINDDTIEVYVSQVPYSVEDDDLKNILREYGDVKTIEREYDKNATGTGRRMVEIELLKHIPRFIALPKIHKKFTWDAIVWYKEQPEEMISQQKTLKRCYICRTIGHLATECGKRTVCTLCKDPNAKPHLEKDCKLNKQLKTFLDEMVVNEVERELQRCQNMDTVANVTMTDEQQLSQFLDEQAQFSAVQDMIFLGDSQMQRIAPLIKSENVTKVSISGGRIHDGSEWLKKNDKSYKTICTYFGTNNVSQTTDGLIKEVKVLINTIKEYANTAYIMGIVPRNSKGGPRSSNKVNKIMMEQTVGEDNLIFIPPPDCFDYEENSESLYEKDKIHVTNLGANQLLQNLKIIMDQRVKKKHAHSTEEERDQEQIIKYQKVDVNEDEVTSEMDGTDNVVGHET